jgi:NhaP-type Na+/H+ or K+/H+ antiporter
MYHFNKLKHRFFYSFFLFLKIGFTDALYVFLMTCITSACIICLIFTLIPSMESNVYQENKDALMSSIIFAFLAWIIYIINITCTCCACCSSLV